MTEAEIAVRRLAEIEAVFAAMASGEARERFGHIKYYDARKPVLVIDNDGKGK